MSTKKTAAAEAEAAAVETTETTATAGTEETVNEAEPVAYLGPDLKNIAINGTVYTNGLPKALEDKIKEIPALRGLLVPISQLAAAGVAITTKGTAINNLYNAVSVKLQEQQNNE